MSKIVSSAEFQKAIGRFGEMAQREPVVITNHGRESLVLLSADEYRRLKQRDRQVLRVEELSDADLAAVLTADIPPEARAFDDELDA